MNTPVGHIAKQQLAVCAKVCAFYKNPSLALPHPFSATTCQRGKDWIDRAVNAVFEAQTQGRLQIEELKLGLGMDPYPPELPRGCHDGRSTRGDVTDVPGLCPAFVSSNHLHCRMGGQRDTHFEHFSTPSDKVM